MLFAGETEERGRQWRKRDSEKSLRELSPVDINTADHMTEVHLAHGIYICVL